MSMYNMVFGFNKCAGPFLYELGINPKDVPRFRDCFLSADGQSIVIYTRTGGGNRDDYAGENEAMRRWPGYLCDEDDTFDSTFALFHFAIPESIKEVCQRLFEQGWGVDPAKRWQDTLKAMETLKND